MRVISNTKKNRVVELDPHERRQHALFERFLDLGATIPVAIRYVEMNLGPIQDPKFREWLS